MSSHHVSHHIAPLTRQLLTLDEIAAVVGMAPITLRRMAARGLIPRMIIGYRTHRYQVGPVLSALEQLHFRRTMTP